jgi:monothiol glutaredoxin
MRIQPARCARIASRLARECMINDAKIPLANHGASLLHSIYQGDHRRVAPAIFSASSFSSSSSSHDDFAPKRKTVSGEDEAMDLIKQHVQENKVMLYMKGNPSMPMCGFSARVVQVLKSEGVDFASVNVLDYPAIREGIKKYSDWPTIPQLYVDGEFVGGCDIVTSMHESGELKELLGSSK